MEKLNGKYTQNEISSARKNKVISFFKMNAAIGNHIKQIMLVSER